MNSADFFTFYLHLANQKTLNNSAGEEDALLTSYFVKEGVNHGLVDKEEDSCTGPLASNFQSNKIKINPSLPLSGTEAAEISSPKEAFTLLAFAGLCQTISLAEWGGASCSFTNIKFFNKPGIFKEPTLSGFAKTKDFFDRSFCKAKTQTQKANNYKISVKLKTLASFKKHNNLVRRKVLFLTKKFSPTSPVNNQVFSSTAGSTYPVFFQKAVSCEGKIPDKAIVKLNSGWNSLLIKPIKASPAKPLVTELILVPRAAETELKHQGLAKRYLLPSKKARTYNLAEFIPKSAKCVKFLSTFNQRVLSQSFRYNFIYHLQKKAPLVFKTSGLCEKSVKNFFFAFNKKAKAKQLCGHRRDHQITLTTSAPILNLHHFVNNSKATVTLPTSALPTFSQHRKHNKRPLNLIEIEGSKTLRQPKTLTGFVQLKKPIGVPVKLGALRESYFEKFNICNPALKIKGLFDPQPIATPIKGSQPFFPGNAGGDLNIYSYNPALTKFYAASWLLDSIRGELSLRNANIRRVLNQTFLLTQQSLISVIEQEAREKGRDFLKGLRTTDKIGKAFNKENSTVIPCLIRGLRVTISGCMGGKKNMSKTLTKTAGRVTTSTFKEKVDFAKGVVQTKTGSLGVKVWICYN